MTHRPLLFCAFLSSLALPACVTFHPVKMNSDPNTERLERAEEKTERDTVESFIAEHPDLDMQTKKELRDGTLSRSAALERLKKNGPAH